MHTYMHTCIHTYIHTHIHTYMHAYIHTYIYMHIAHMHTCTHIYIYKHVCPCRSVAGDDGVQPGDRGQPWAFGLSDGGWLEPWDAGRVCRIDQLCFFFNPAFKTGYSSTLLSTLLFFNPSSPFTRSRLRRALLQPLRCLPHGCVAAILLHLLQRFMDFMLLRMFLLVVEVDWLMGLLLLACILVAAAWLMGLFLVEAEGLFLAEADWLMGFLVARILVECWLLVGIPVLRWLLGLLVCIRHMEVLLGPLLDHTFLMEVKPWLDPCFRLGRRWLGCHMVMGFSRMVRRRCCSLLGRILPGPWARLLLAVQFWVCRQMSWCSRRQGCE